MNIPFLWLVYSIIRKKAKELMILMMEAKEWMIIALMRMRVVKVMMPNLI